MALLTKKEGFLSKEGSIDGLLTGAIGKIDGISVYESPYCVKTYQFRFPKSKKKRIRKKWTKKKENWRTDPVAYMTPRQIFAHPSIIYELKKQVGRIECSSK